MSNTGGVEDTDRDIVADLNDTSLTDGHAQLLDVYNDIHKARLKKLVNGELGKFDHYHCWFCQKHFKKLSFFKGFPENQWLKQDPELKKELFSHE